MEEISPQFLKEDQWFDVDIGPNILDVTEAYIRPKFTLAYKGSPFAPLGGIHALTGQPGNGKTMTFTQLMVAIMRGEYGGLTYELADEVPNPSVLYIDTEMEKGNTQLVNLRVYSMMGWAFGVPHEEFKVLWLREEVDAATRWRKTLKAIYQMKPTVVFLDGLLDVIGDFNDNKECQQLIYKCMATASHYNISLWCLLHENPNSTKMVGHAGSTLERKVTDVLGTKKSKEGGVVTFTVSQKKARGKDIEDWSFEVTDDTNRLGIPVQLLPPEPPEEDTPFDIHTVTEEQMLQCTMLITSRDGITTREFYDGIKSTFHISTAKAQKLTAMLEEKGYVFRNENKRYYLPDNNVTEGSVPF